MFLPCIITQLITVWVLSSHHCVGFLFLGLHSAPSPPSPPPLLLSLNFTQVLSHNSHNSSHTNPLISQLTQLISHNSSRTTQLTQLISLNSSHTTQLTRDLFSCSIWWSCFRVAGAALAAAGVAFVWQAREFDSLQAAACGAPGAASACSVDCRCALGLNSSHTTQLTQLNVSQWTPPHTLPTKP